MGNPQVWCIFEQIWNMLLSPFDNQHMFSTPIINPSQPDPELYSIFLSASMDSTFVADACKSLTRVKHQGGLAIFVTFGSTIPLITIKPT